MRNLRVSNDLDLGQVFVLELLGLLLEASGRILTHRVEIGIELLALLVHKVLLLIQVLDGLIQAIHLLELFGVARLSRQKLLVDVLQERVKAILGTDQTVLGYRVRR